MKKKTRRVLILLSLLLATLLYRIPDMYKAVVGDSIAGGMGTVDGVEQGFLTVKAVKEKDTLGRVTPAHKAGIKPADKIVAIYDSKGNGGPIRSLADYGAAITTVSSGEPWSVVVRRAVEGRETEVRVALDPVDDSQIPKTLEIFLTSMLFLLPLLTIGTAFFVGFMKPEDDTAFLGALLFLSFSVIFGTFLAANPRPLLPLAVFYFYTANAFLVYLFMRFFLVFPSPSPLERRLPWLKTAGLVFALAIWGLNLLAGAPQFFSFALHERLWGAIVANERLGTFLKNAIGVWPDFAMLVVGFASLVLNTVKSPTRDERRRLMILLAGTFLGLVPLVAMLVYVGITGDKAPPLALIILVVSALALFPLSFAYVVVKHRVFGIRLIIRRGLQYLLVSRGFAFFEGILIFAVLYFGARSLFTTFYPGAGPAAISGVTVVVTLAAVSGMRKINQPVMRSIDRRFFREAYDAQRILTDLSRAVRKLAAQPDQLVTLVAERVEQSLHPSHVAVFLRKGQMHECAHLLRRGDGDGPAAGTIEADRLSIGAEAVIPRHLESLPESEPIEIYPEGPRSISTSLVRVGTQAEQMVQERRVIERLGARLILPLKTSDGLIGFVSLGEKLSEEPYTRDDKDLLRTVAEQTSIALEYGQLVRQVADQEKLKREVEIAKEVQARLFPQSHPAMQTLEYVCVCKAARGVAGDYYDFLRVSPSRLGLAIADVSGKGIGASLLMATLQALLRSHAPVRGDDLRGLATDLNRLMCESTDHNKYATFFYAVYDDLSRQLSYVNAGHNPPMLFRPMGGILPTATDADLPSRRRDELETIRLDRGGMAVGMFDVASYEEETVHLSSGDILVAFTDGVSEALNSREEEFGEQRLNDLVATHSTLPAKELCAKILDDLAQFVGEAPQFDDITLLVARVL
ncbi:MAG: SpoIIE family protein phosphatase [Acidobacteria bacterium]|nr:SpoIIE family protein phosphatase [Acidobacteriota bacterium]